MQSALEIIDKQEWLDKTGEAVQPVILNSFKAAGKTGNTVKNLLHGKWLGHPVHPMITDIPLGAWTTAVVLDIMEINGTSEYKPGADAAVAIGIIGAVGAAFTGITDWTGTTSIERKTGLAHGLMNMGAMALYTSSYFLRKKKKFRIAGIALSMLGYGITALSAYVGGTLVYNKQMGVNHTAIPEGYPADFIAVLPKNKLREGQMKCVKAQKVDVLLAKKNKKIYAIANTCSHLGGPLFEGNLLTDCSVQCPWHQSVFSLEDGSVVDGPATQPQPTFDVRIKNDMIEIKLKSGWV